MLAFSTVVLGGFRGLLADMLWLRASRLQDEGRYFELVQLAEWITRLEPRATGIWAFHAWNMVYNVSAMMADPDERWQWVQSGVRLLREDGLRYNPRDTRLHFEIGWIFQHKIGSPTDPEYVRYQQRLVRTVADILPEGRLALPGSGDEAAAPRALALRRALGLDLNLMREIERVIGPLDWRLPESHSLYWAYRGLTRSGVPDDMLCTRMLCQSLATSVFYGRLVLDPAAGAYRREPRPELLDAALERYRLAIAARTWSGAGDSYDAFLASAADLMDRHGRSADARRLRVILDARRPPMP